MSFKRPFREHATSSLPRVWSPQFGINKKFKNRDKDKKDSDKTKISVQSQMRRGSIKINKKIIVDRASSSLGTRIQTPQKWWKWSEEKSNLLVSNNFWKYLFMLWI